MTSLPDPIITLAKQAVHERWLLAFDFDGTLVPLADHPDAVVFSHGAYHDLESLSRTGRVVVLSGRARADLVARCPRSALLIGNHGSDGLPGTDGIKDEAIRTTSLWLPRLRASFTGGGCWVEDKDLSLSMHWRAAADHALCEAVAHRLADDLWPKPTRIPGHLVLNLVPPGLLDKGQALRLLLDQRQPAGVLFVGDDWTDASVFAMADPRVHGIQVGDLPLGALHRLPDQGAVGPLLHLLAKEAARYPA